ncbi:MAG: 1-deoxy-D-xylulose-5-phosphate reductoisomerase, partial [bacterium]|nr:1-deoxy-D-xylulose-5-phosphate reductoisomerase [bacterium]
MRHIALLGSTGSIGRNTLAVIEQNRDKFQVTSIVAGENIELLEKQIESFSPAVVSVKNKGDAQLLQQKFPDLKVYNGKGGLLEAVSHPSVDTML